MRREKGKVKSVILVHQYNNTYYYILKAKGLSSLFYL